MIFSSKIISSTLQQALSEIDRLASRLVQRQLPRELPSNSVALFVIEDGREKHVFGISPRDGRARRIDLTKYDDAQWVMCKAKSPDMTAFLSGLLDPRSARERGVSVLGNNQVVLAWLMSAWAST